MEPAKNALAAERLLRRVYQHELTFVDVDVFETVITMQLRIS